MFPISDSKYAEELQFQETLMSSVIASKSSVPPLMMIEEKAKAEEVGESSHFTAREFCVEKKEADEMFRIDTCSHSFCSDCISKHVTMKIQDHICLMMFEYIGDDVRMLMMFTIFLTMFVDV
ncbi:hypothetical protein LOK49_LG03G00494 [Camellia lanceoleosa]|uniref:Uncharacterized protein n=1 Tax=Camellia lanceoleosa TaxID=1840588 RepID=A0ACC0IDS2_9ERIC|nr:hypothetical protein LOK49_LG03G00494 [Camellia lanceoleosa]